MNVILITVDCLRADHLSCMGYHRLTSPFIDSLAKKGVKFTHAIVNGAGTFASFTALMTSTYPFMKGTFERVNRKTLAEVLSKVGYTTAGINDNGFLSPYFGFDRGFKYFNCLSVQNNKHSKLNKALDIVKNAFQVIVGGDYGMNGKIVTKLAIDWIKDHKDEKFFLWIHYMDVHGPHYAPKRYYKLIGVKPPSFLEQVKLNKKLGNEPEALYKRGLISKRDVDLLISTYDAEIRYIDRCIQELYKFLEKFNIENETYIVITGDHGEEFFEHGGYHSNLNLYDEMIRVPLIIYGPNLNKSTINEQVRQIDIAPTILALLNEEGVSEFIGSNLLNECGSRYVITEAAHYTIGRRESGKIVEMNFNLRKTSVRAIVNGQVWKYIQCTKTKTEELYNLTRDPSEKYNLINKETYKNVLTILQGLLEKHILMEMEYMKINTIARKIKK